ncbi:hypothetical protein A3218_00795 [Pseudomonas chlororaphis]|nr:hypothetical protein A3218_00795 [Pseudomonas chlororaphis]
MKGDEFPFFLKGVKPSRMQYSRDSGYADDFFQALTVTWAGLTIEVNDQISVPVILGDMYCRMESNILLQAV